MQNQLKVKNGDSIENAIIIDVPNSILGVNEEHEHIERICGIMDKDFKSVEQNLFRENKKVYDKFVITMNDGTEKILFFEITSFFGRI